MIPFTMRVELPPKLGWIRMKSLSQWKYFHLVALGLHPPGGSAKLKACFCIQPIHQIGRHFITNNNRSNTFPSNKLLILGSALPGLGWGQIEKPISPPLQQIAQVWRTVLIFHHIGVWLNNEWQHSQNYFYHKAILSHVRNVYYICTKWNVHSFSRWEALSIFAKKIKACFLILHHRSQWNGCC